MPCWVGLAERDGSCDGDYPAVNIPDRHVSSPRPSSPLVRDRDSERANSEPSDSGAGKGANAMGSILTDVLDALDARVGAVPTDEPVLSAFAAWVGALGDAGGPTLRRIALASSEREGASRHYQDVAVLGFACARQVWRDAAEEELIRRRFRDGLAWMSGRRFFVAGQPPGFEGDGIALIGIGVGIAGDGSSPDAVDRRRWLGDILTRSLSNTSSGAWDAALLRGAATILAWSEAQRTGPIRGLADLTPDLAAALAALGIVTLSETEERAARATILTPSYRYLPSERAAVQAAALRWLMRLGATVLPTRATVADVVALLQGVPHALKRWPWEEKPRTSRAGAMPQTWDVQNEYHVQSLVWALLAPVFADLEDEEYLHSIGHKHPRVDLAIPSLGLIIEVKFMRGGAQGDLAKVIEEVSSDTGLYLSVPSKFTQILVFVWDDSRSNDQHAELLAGVRKLRGITDAVGVSRPGRWDVSLSGSS